MFDQLMAKRNESAKAEGLERRKAYSYLRFSTPEQRDGDSFRRQTTMAQDYAKRHDLHLDTDLTFHDLGVSGYRGQNADAGRLADFLEAVTAGAVPRGSVLLVEQLDRLSRMTPLKAIQVLQSIVEAGVSVVTLNDEREYTANSIHTDQISLLVSLLTFMRANEESATKARRLAQSWEAKRATMRTKPLTSKAPAWLQLDPQTRKFAAIPERAVIVRRIFAMTLEGAGQNKIAETFNREGIPTWGRGKHWHRSYVAKVLTNPAVIGTITPHVMDHSSGRKLRQALEPVPEYYPAVISQETWDDVQALQSAHVATSKGAPISNILAGLATCPKCGNTMTRVQKGKKSPPAFVCTAAKVGAGCEYKSVRYQWVEDRLLRVLPDIISEREGIELIDEVEGRIWNLEQAALRLREQIETILDNLAEENSPSLRARLRQREADLEALQAERRSLEERRDVAAGPVIGSRIARAIEAMRGPSDGLDRAEANRALRSLFVRAVINWPEGTIDLEWKAGGSCRVHYAMRDPAPYRPGDYVTG